MMLLIIGTNYRQKQQKGKTKEDVKKELFKSIRKSNKEYHFNLDEIDENVIKLKGAITVIKRY